MIVLMCGKHMLKLNPIDPDYRRGESLSLRTDGYVIDLLKPRLHVVESLGICLEVSVSPLALSLLKNEDSPGWLMTDNPNFRLLGHPLLEVWVLELIPKWHHVIHHTLSPM